MLLTLLMAADNVSQIVDRNPLVPNQISFAWPAKEAVDFLLGGIFRGKSLNIYRDQGVLLLRVVSRVDH
jgi:hypothetical protein